MHPIRTLEKSPDFGRGFLLPFYDICNIGEPVLFSETVGKPQKLIFRASNYLILLHPNLGKLQKLDFFDSLSMYLHCDTKSRILTVQRRHQAFA